MGVREDAKSSTTAGPKRPTRDALAKRQAIIRKQVLRQAADRTQPMQTQRELEAIPEGAEVVVHLLFSACGAAPAHRKGLATFGLLENKPRGKKRRLPPGHVGRTAHHVWHRGHASARVQQLTRYMYVDAIALDEPLGSSVAPAKSESEDDMSFDHYETSRKKPAVFVTRGGRGVQIESQPDGFGMTWPTQLDALAAVEEALAVLHKPKKDDEAVLVIDSDPPKTLPATELVDLLSKNRGHVSLIRMDIGAASLAWADAAKERRMSFGDDFYVRPLVRTLLERTADLPGKDTLDRLLDAADKALRENAPPQS